LNAERHRLQLSKKRLEHWKLWGPYLSERQWGTVREDYSDKGSAWEHFSHDHSRSRAYRWGEDGIMGYSDRHCRLCIAPAFWNGNDTILKERFFGLTGNQGNHGEDVKELYYYLESTPTHSYNHTLYQYPYIYPYDELVRVNHQRTVADREYEINDSKVWEDNKYFDIHMYMAKSNCEDLLFEYRIINRGPVKAPLHIFPSIWFRNTWAWACRHEGCTLKPTIKKVGQHSLLLQHESMPTYRFMVDPNNPGFKEFMMTENETNTQNLYGHESHTPYTKDAFHRYIIDNERDAINPKNEGTKAAAHYHLNIEPQEEVRLRFRLVKEDQVSRVSFGEPFHYEFKRSKNEADLFYKDLIPKELDEEEVLIQRQAYAGLLFTKQFYHYSVIDWLEGDNDVSSTPKTRLQGRNSDWKHFFARDIISMPDKWEYPWFATWDLAFHLIPFAHLDPDFACEQLILFTREWFLHPNGQMPAYEWDFGDVNPPVHAWACWRVYKMTGPKGDRDINFLKRCFHKLMLNFTWWVNRKDPNGKNIFTGGFLGLDNISVFDRSQDLPTGGYMHQADGTAWMAFYSLTMLGIAFEITKEDPAYEDVASKFFEHFVVIADAMNQIGDHGLWHEEDGFYYDQLRLKDSTVPIRVRSVVGLIPLYSVLALDQELLNQCPEFKNRMDWYLNHRKDLAKHITYMECSEKGHRYLLAIPKRERLERVLKVLFDEEEFLSEYGIRGLSKYHEKNPYIYKVGNTEYKVKYNPSESDNHLFGGNSNWRGPIWFPVNYLIVEALQRYHYFYGDDLKVEVPTGSGCLMNLNDAASELERRLASLFKMNKSGKRPVHEDQKRYQQGEPDENLILFYEYFHGDTGRGVGANHQTGWTALIAKMQRDLAKSRRNKKV
jgi:hypothetical protein